MKLYIDTMPELRWEMHTDWEEQLYAKTVFGIYWITPDEDTGTFDLSLAHLYDTNLNSLANQATEFGLFDSIDKAQTQAYYDYVERTSSRFIEVNVKKIEFID